MALYANLPTEVGTAWLRDALWQRAVRTAFPRVTDDGLVFHWIRDLSEFEPGCMGILEPLANLEPVEPATLDLVFVPGVAFTRAGDRLGQGGAYYDRFLGAPACRRAKRVGLAFEAQLAATLPTEPHDCTLDQIVTERSVYRCR